MIRTALFWASLAAYGARISAQEAVTVRDAGPGLPGRILESALGKSHTVIDPRADTTSLPAGRFYPTTVIIFARHATIGGEVHGDVIMVGGDVFVHPGAKITGRVIAMGGGAYSSPLGEVDQGLISFRDETFDVVRSGEGVALEYRTLSEKPAPAFALPGFYGFGVPMYDRSNGVSVPFAAAFSLDSSHGRAEPALTYRSQLGVVDPSLTAAYRFDRHTDLGVWAGRSTFTNDGWIKSDLVNSAIALTTGTDSRNWYRADRASGYIRELWDGLRGSVEPHIGFRTERAFSVGPDSAPVDGPWSLFGRTSSQGMLRPNPPITPGTISSVLAGGEAAWDDEGIKASLSTDVEFAFHAPQGIITRGEVPSDAQFTQGTVNAVVAFPTFGSERYVLQVHAVATAGAAPPQRWAYLGGAGTLGTLDMLQLGGDELLLVDSRYEFPITAIAVPLVGSPVFALRHIIGSAGVGRLPALTQIVGLRLSLTPVEVELLMDTAKRKLELSTGLSFVR